jgi:hypothetical protein
MSAKKKDYCVKAAFRHVMLKSADFQLKKTQNEMYQRSSYEAQQNRKFEITKRLLDLNNRNKK